MLVTSSGRLLYLTPSQNRTAIQAHRLELDCHRDLRHERRMKEFTPSTLSLLLFTILINSFAQFGLKDQLTSFEAALLTCQIDV